MVDFTVADSLAEHRKAASAWVTSHFDERWAVEERRSGTYHTEELHLRLGEEGILGAGWPREYGGSDVAPQLSTAIMQELEDRGAHQEAWITTDMILRTILAVGTDEQKHRWIPEGLQGRLKIVLGYTEPESGSDAAAASLRAVADGDHWTLNGSKMFTSTAQAGTHVFLLTRTNTEVRKHRGLTMFLVPLDSPGVEIQPVHTLGGQRTNATFYNDVRVGDDARVGAVDGGWDVMRVALVHERGVLHIPSGPTLSQRLSRWAAASDDGSGARVWDSPSVREQIAGIAIEEEVSRLLSMDMVAAARDGDMSGVQGSMRKMFAPEAAQRHLSLAMSIIGPASLARLPVERIGEGSTASLPGEIEFEFRNAVVDTLYGGSTEIMREIVAERHLGLPRNRPSS